MSTLTEKITLYDFVGYLIPGAVAEGVIILFLLRDIAIPMKVWDSLGYLLLVFVVVAYIMGVVLSEVSGKIANFCIDNDLFCSQSDVVPCGSKKVTEALQNAGVIEKNVVVQVPTEEHSETGETSEKQTWQNNQEVKGLENYYGYMYADIQVTPKYNRLHNYACMELFCRNMAVASIFVAFCAGFVLAKIEIVIVGFLLAWIFFAQWGLQYSRKMYYMICWFVQKYAEDSKEELGNGNVSIELSLNTDIRN